MFSQFLYVLQGDVSLYALIAIIIVLVRIKHIPQGSLFQFLFLTIFFFGNIKTIWLSSMIQGKVNVPISTRNCTLGNHVIIMLRIIKKSPRRSFINAGIQAKKFFNYIYVCQAYERSENHIKYIENDPYVFHVSNTVVYIYRYILNLCTLSNPRGSQVFRPPQR